MCIRDSVLAERQKKDNLAHMLMFISYIFLCYVLSPVAFLAAWPAAPHKCKNVENPLVFVGRKTYAAFSREGRSDQIVEGLGCKNPPENRLQKKLPRGHRKSDKHDHF